MIERPSFIKTSDGQMCKIEKDAMYDTIVLKRPDICFEIGTWLGRGSTYCIASALYANGGGYLHTVETISENHAYAAALYRGELKHLGPFVSFHLGYSTEVYPRLLQHYKSTGRLVDFLILDGGDVALQTVEEYEMFKPYLSPKAILACHDWNVEKMGALRPLLEQEIEQGLWNTLVAFDHTDTGFRIFEKKATIV